MSQNLDFDRVVADWLKSDGPADIRTDAVDRAFGFARASGQRRGLRLALVGPAPWPAYGRRIGFGTLPPAVRVALALALLLALTAGAAVVGARLLQIIQPSAAHMVVITTGSSTPCPASGGGTTTMSAPTAVDLDTDAVRPLAIECQAGLLLSPDGVHAAGVAGQRLIVSDLRAGTSRVFRGAEGTDVEAIQWSPKGTYLYWVGDNSAPRPTTLFVSSIADAHHSPLPTGVQGGYGAVTWSLDETRLLAQVPDTVGWLLGNGDGTAFRSLTGVGQQWLAMSPDGRLFAFARDRSNAAGQLVATDLLVGDGFSPPSPVTSFTDSGIIRAATWLPDGSALAAVVTHQRPEIATLEGVIELELLEPTRVNVVRRFQLPAIGAAFDQPYYSITASPLGRFVAISRRVITHVAQGGDEYHEAFVIVRLADGMILPRPSQRLPELTEGGGWTAARLSDVFFSPDDRRVVYHVPGSFQVVDLDGSGVKHLSLSDVAPLGWGDQLVWLTAGE